MKVPEVWRVRRPPIDIAAKTWLSGEPRKWFESRFPKFSVPQKNVLKAIHENVNFLQIASSGSGVSTAALLGAASHFCGTAEVLWVCARRRSAHELPETWSESAGSNIVQQVSLHHALTLEIDRLGLERVRIVCVDGFEAVVDLQAEVEWSRFVGRLKSKAPAAFFVGWSFPVADPDGVAQALAPESETVGLHDSIAYREVRFRIFAPLRNTRFVLSENQPRFTDELRRTIGDWPHTEVSLTRANDELIAVAAGGTLGGSGESPQLDDHRQGLEPERSHVECLVANNSAPIATDAEFGRVGEAVFAGLCGCPQTMIRAAGSTSGALKEHMRAVTFAGNALDISAAMIVHQLAGLGQIDAAPRIRLPDAAEVVDGLGIGSTWRQSDEPQILVRAGIRPLSPATAAKLVEFWTKGSELVEVDDSRLERTSYWIVSQFLVNRGHAKAISAMLAEQRRTGGFPAPKRPVSVRCDAGGEGIRVWLAPLGFSINACIAAAFAAKYPSAGRWLADDFGIGCLSSKGASSADALELETAAIQLNAQTSREHFSAQRAVAFWAGAEITVGRDVFSEVPAMALPLFRAGLIKGGDCCSLLST